MTLDELDETIRLRARLVAITGREDPELETLRDIRALFDRERMESYHRGWDACARHLAAEGT